MKTSRLDQEKNFLESIRLKLDDDVDNTVLLLSIRSLGTHLSQIYPKDSLQLKSIAECEHNANLLCSNYPGAIRFKPETISKIKAIIEMVENEFKLTGIPSFPVPDEEGKTNITISQNQTQTTSLKFDVVINTLKDELTPKQVRDLREIANSSNEIDHDTLVGKIKSWGADVAASVLGNILSSPNIWTGIIG